MPKVSEESQFFHQYQSFVAATINRNLQNLGELPLYGCTEEVGEIPCPPDQGSCLLLPVKGEGETLYRC